MSDLYAVMGNPIGHSKSPDIHSAFATQTEEDMVYSAMLVPIESFKKSADDFFRNALGTNITVPFKQNAFEYADILTERAQRAGAVNTLTLKDGKIVGDTTDGVGLVRDLLNNKQCEIKDKKILVLGAGGAVRGILEPLLAQAPASLLIANRTDSKAVSLANDFSALGNINGCGFNEVSASEFDLIINGTSASLSGELPPIPEQVIASTTICYDMMYAAKPTVFNQWAQKLGAAQCIDGLGMLVEQAAESFFIWRNVRPTTGDVINTLRNQLKES
jgi:shikimate dehydrogenase